MYKYICFLNTDHLLQTAHLYFIMKMVKKKKDREERTTKLNEIVRSVGHSSTKIKFDWKKLFK